MNNTKGLLITAVGNLLGAVRPQEPVFVRSLVKAMLSAALVRMKTERRMAYLEQWFHLISWLPDALADIPAEERPYVLVSTIEQFQLQNMRGKRKPAVFPEGDIRLRSKKGDIWLVRRSNDGRIEYVCPLNPPRVLKREVGSLNFRLPSWKTKELASEQRRMELEKQIANIAPDTPANKIKAWLNDRHTPSEIALLIGARRACMTDTDTAANLRHLYEAIRLAR